MSNLQRDGQRLAASLDTMAQSFTQLAAALQRQQAPAALAMAATDAARLYAVTSRAVGVLQRGGSGAMLPGANAGLALAELRFVQELERWRAQWTADAIADRAGVALAAEMGRVCGRQ